MDSWEDLLCGADEPQLCGQDSENIDTEIEKVIVNDDGDDDDDDDEKPSRKKPRVEPEKLGPTSWATRLQAILDLTEVQKVKWRVMTACSGTGSPIIGLQACLLLHIPRM